jgi:BirA family transcriptional regulator, biotin operon repressor / biotin---[acetyl-CoA-carboxylase] ligase
VLSPIIHLSTVDSTQRVAWEAVDAGAGDGTVVVADEQTAGRGRHGDAWLAPAGTSLLVSLVLRPALTRDTLPLLSYAAALAVGDALERVARLTTRLKWPNDVLVGDRKLAGILLEARADGTPVVVVGIGINLAQRAFPAALAGATSVALETGAVPERDVLLEALGQALGEWRGVLETAGFPPLRHAWLGRTATIGRRVVADGGAGVAVDLAPDGALVIETSAGLVRVVAGAIEERG